MKTRRRLFKRTLLLLSFCFFLLGSIHLTLGSGGEDEKEEIKKIRVAISPFQDVFSLHIAEEKGWDLEEGLDMTLIEVDWPGAQELLASGDVQFANSVIGDVLVRYDKVEGLILANILWYFQGHGIQVRGDSEFKTYDELKEMGYSDEEAKKMALMQLKGKDIILPMKVGIEVSLKAFADGVGMNFPDDFNMIDMPHAEGLAAFLGGSGDAYIGGIPQRLRGVKEGNKILIDDDTFPAAIMHAGFSTTRDFLAENPDIEVKFQKLIFRVLKYCETDPDDAFPIIVREINRATGGQYSVETLRDDVWNKMEYFPTSAENLFRDTILPDGPYNWKVRFDYVIEGYLQDGTITKPAPAADLFEVSETLEKLMKTYEPDAYKRTFGKIKAQYKNNPKEYKSLFGLEYTD